MQALLAGGLCAGTEEAADGGVHAEMMAGRAAERQLRKILREGVVFAAGIRLLDISGEFVPAEES